MEFKEFEEKVLDDIIPNRNEHLRPGQALMGYLHEVWPEEYKRIVADNFDKYTGIDCFYNSRLIPKTLKHLESVWHKYPN